jgi:nucleoside phosphorylase
MNHTVVFLTALPLEYEAVVAYLSQRRKEIKSDNTIYEIGEYVTPQARWQVVVRKLAAQGNYQAIRETEWAITHFDPAYMFLVGVAGGLKDVQLGDVVAASLVRGYEGGKITDGGWKPRALVEHPSQALLQLAHNLAGETQWLKKLSSLPQPAPKAWIAPMASGEKVISSRAFLAQLQETCSDAVAVEMEALGFLGTFRAKSQVQGIVIRGVSDLIGDKKLDTNWHSIAAQNAAAFAFAMLDQLMPVTQPVTMQPPSTYPPDSLDLPTEVKKTCNPWLRSAIWCILTTFFGLFQVWITITVHQIILLDVPLPPKKLFMDGAFLFFSTAVITSLAVDYYYLSKRAILPEIEHLAFVAFPFLIVLSSLILFMGCYMSDIPGHEMKINQNAVGWGENFVIITTLIYAFVIKWATFKLECGENN